MKFTKINSDILNENILPEIVIKRSFYNFPRKIRLMYSEKKAAGAAVFIGLDVHLGYYLMKQDLKGKAELLWWENRTLEVAVT